MSAHTPGPWRTGEGIGHFGRNRVWAGTSLDIPVATVISQSMQPPDVDQEAQAKAEKFIVRACNLHNELVAALLTIAESDTVGGVSAGERKGLSRAAAVARAALAKVEA